MTAILCSHGMGLLGCVSFLLLPGVGLIKRRRDPVEWLGAVFSCSVAVNLFLLMLLCLLGLGSRGLVIGLSVLELAALLFCGIVRRINRAEVPGAPKLCLSVRPEWALAIPIVFVILYKALFFPFLTWDAIASWNMIARNITIDPKWFSRYPFFYTQYTSLSASVPYFWSGQVDVEYYSHAIFGAHVIMLYAVLSELSRLLRAHPAFSFIFVFIFLPISSYMGDGYSDIASSIYAFWSVLFLWKSIRIKSLNPSGQALLENVLLRAAFLASTSYLFKQSGWVFVIIFAILCVFVLDRRRTFISKLKRFSGFIAASLVPIMLWHGLSTPEATSHQLAGVVSAFDPHRTLVKAFVTAWTSIGREMTTFSSVRFDQSLFVVVLACLVTIGFYRKIHRVWSITLLIFTLVWSLTANYDLRALSPVLMMVPLLVSATLLRGLSRRLVIGISVLPVIVFLTSQGFNEFKYRKVFDYQPGERWFAGGVLESKANKLARSYPAFLEFENWKKYVYNDPESRVNRVWADGLTRTALDPSKIDGGAQWLSFIEKTPGRFLWQKDDIIFLGWHMALKDRFRDEHAILYLDGVSRPEMSWREWCDRLTQKGILKREMRFGRSPIYRVVDARSISYEELVN